MQLTNSLHIKLYRERGARNRAAVRSGGLGQPRRFRHRYNKHKTFGEYKVSSEAKHKNVKELIFSWTIYCLTVSCPRRSSEMRGGKAGELTGLLAVHLQVQGFICFDKPAISPPLLSTMC